MLAPCKEKMHISSNSVCGTTFSESYNECVIDARRSRRRLDIPDAFQL